MKDKNLKKLILEAKKAYHNKAKLVIEGDKLLIRNLCPPHVVHPFIDGRDHIKLSRTEIVEVNELIK